MEQKTVFISYRRKPTQGMFLSRLVHEFLTTNGYNVFLDIVTMGSGDFDRIIMNQIAAKAHFILILTKGALRRCDDPEDWVRREIEEALRLNRNIVPIMDEDVDFAEEMRYLPNDIREKLDKKNGIPFNHRYYKSFVDNVLSFLRNAPRVNTQPTPANEISEVERFKEAINSTIPELVVDVRGTGHYTRITDALNAAPAGARIIVKPGTYLEGLTLSKPVTIEGQGDRNRIIIQSYDQSCLTMDTDEATVVGLSLRSVLINRELNRYTVDIPKGRLLLSNCDITSDSLGCIGIYNANARPYIVDCMIHDGKVGVAIFDNGSGVIEDCEVYNNSNFGLAIRTSGNPTVRRCKFRDGKSSGIMVFENGSGLIEDCEIYNTSIGLGIRTAGNPTVRRCIIRDGKSAGVVVYDDGIGLIEDCEIYANVSAGIAIKSGGNPTVRRCTFRDGKAGGVWINENGNGLIEDCEIYGNNLCGVEIQANDNLTIRGCKIIKNGQRGVYALNNARGTVENCDLRGNKLGAWSIDKTSNITRQNNLA